MANRVVPLHPGIPNWNKYLVGDLLNDNADSYEDVWLPKQAYRVIATVQSAGVLTLIAPSKGNASATIALDGDTAQEIDLHAVLTTYLFPSHVMRCEATLRTRVAFTGGAISAITGELGDTGDPNGLLTASSMFTASTGAVSTVAAAEYANRSEVAFIPTLTLTSTNGNLVALTAGLAEIVIQYQLLPQ